MADSKINTSTHASARANKSKEFKVQSKPSQKNTDFEHYLARNLIGFGKTQGLTQNLSPRTQLLNSKDSTTKSTKLSHMFFGPKGSRSPKPHKSQEKSSNQTVKSKLLANSGIKQISTQKESNLYSLLKKSHIHQNGLVVISGNFGDIKSSPRAGNFFDLKTSGKFKQSELAPKVLKTSKLHNIEFLGSKYLASSGYSKLNTKMSGREHKTKESLKLKNSDILENRSKK